MSDLLRRLPVFRMIPASRMVLLTDFSAAALGGIGIHAIMVAPAGIRKRMALFVLTSAGLLAAVAAGSLAHDWEAMRAAGVTSAIGRQIAWFAGVGAVATFVGRVVLLGRGMSALAAAALLTAELASLIPFGPPRAPFLRTREIFPREPSIEFMRTDPGLYRVLMPVANVAAVYGLSDAQGCDGMTPRQIELLVRPDDSMSGFGNDALLFGNGSPVGLLSAMNVKYLLVPPGTQPGSPGLRVVYRGKDATVLVNPRVLPRFLAVTAARVRLEDREIMSFVREGTVDLRHVVLLSGEGPPSAGISGIEEGMTREYPRRIWGGVVVDLPPRRRPMGRATVVEYRAGAATVRAEMPAPGWVVFLETYSPGWRVLVNGSAQRVFRANGAFQAVRVLKGASLLRFSYRPRTWPLATALTLLGLALCVWLSAGHPGIPRWTRLRRRGGPHRGRRCRSSQTQSAPV